MAFTKALVVLAVLAPVNISVIAWYARFTATMWIFAGLAISGLLFGGLVIVWDQLTRPPGG